MVLQTEDGLESHLQVCAAIDGAATCTHLIVI